jgi:nicotinamidase-related amidase
MTAPSRAFIVIDVQNDYFSGPLEIQHPPREETLARIVRSMDSAREAGVPVLTVQHILPTGAPVFAEGSEGARLHPEVEQRAATAAKHLTKDVASVFAVEGVAEWLRDRGIDTVTLVGFMTNNCVLGTAAGGEPLGFTVEVIADATGAISLSNEAGTAGARQVHETLLTLLHSNWAAVADTTAWEQALAAGTPLPKSDLGTSAVMGRAAQ